ncbi:hypothetical protein MKX01_014225 [Papaver californicum]|nr:hypothetical protein MKX01_014225 [Papaver californicum]
MIKVTNNLPGFTCYRHSEYLLLTYHCSLKPLLIDETIVGCERDLSPVTDKLWKKFYEKHFGAESTKRLLNLENVQEVSGDNLFVVKIFSAGRESRQIQVVTEVPPAKRPFWGGSGGLNVTNMKILANDVLNASHKEFAKTSLLSGWDCKNDPMPVPSYPSKL